MALRSIERFMRMALRLAAKGRGRTSPNPMVGAVLVKQGEIIGRGWHRAAGQPHAEIEALRDAGRHGHSAKGATLYVTLEPCCTHGRTPPCTEAIIAAGIRRVVVAAKDPNPRHAGRGFRRLRCAGVHVTTGVLDVEATKLNEAFNHWIVHRTPFVIVKSAMTLDGRIATAAGESRWITGPKARAEAMRMRAASDAILVGVNTVLADDPSLTVRKVGSGRPEVGAGNSKLETRNSKLGTKLRRIVLDAFARTPLSARIVTDDFAGLTTIVVSRAAPKRQVAALARRVRVLTAPARDGRIDPGWLLKRLGKEEVTCLLVEGGGEVNGSFLFGGHAHRVAFFYAPKILGGRDARRAVAGTGASRLDELRALDDVRFRWFGDDLLLTARLASRGHPKVAR